MVSISQITFLPITNVSCNWREWENLGLEKHIDEWIESTFCSENEYLNARANHSLLSCFRLLFRSFIEISCRGKSYPLYSIVLYAPSHSRPPKFFYLRAGEEVSATVAGIDEREASKAISDALMNSTGDLCTTWEKWFKNTRNPTEIVVSNKLKIVNRLGLHARAANQLVGMAIKFQSEIYVLSRSMVANAKLLLDLLTLDAHLGSSVDIIASGPDAKHAVEALSILISSRFNEVN